MLPFTVHPVGDCALLAGFTQRIAPEIGAAVAALTLAGLPTDRFLFAGFLPAKAGARATAIAELGAVRATLVLYESAARTAATLGDLARLLGPRPAAVAGAPTAGEGAVGAAGSCDIWRTP